MEQGMGSNKQSASLFEECKAVLSRLGLYRQASGADDQHMDQFKNNSGSTRSKASLEDMWALKAQTNAITTIPRQASNLNPSVHQPVSRQFSTPMAETPVNTFEPHAGFAPQPMQLAEDFTTARDQRLAAMHESPTSHESGSMPSSNGTSSTGHVGDMNFATSDEEQHRLSAGGDSVNSLASRGSLGSLIRLGPHQQGPVQGHPGQPARVQGHRSHHKAGTALVRMPENEPFLPGDATVVKQKHNPQQVSVYVCATADPAPAHTQGAQVPPPASTPFQYQAQAGAVGGQLEYAVPPVNVGGDATGEAASRKRVLSRCGSGSEPGTTSGLAFDLTPSKLVAAFRNSFGGHMPPASAYPQGRASGWAFMGPNKHSARISQRPTVPRLDLSVLSSSPTCADSPTHDLPHLDSAQSMDTEDDEAEELSQWAAPPKWAPLHEGRFYVYSPVNTMDIHRCEALKAALPPHLAHEVEYLWSSLNEARYACELMASRGVRVAKDVTREWSEMSTHLIQRIESHEAAAADMQAYCEQQNMLIQQLTYQLKLAQMTASIAQGDSSSMGYSPMRQEPVSSLGTPAMGRSTHGGSIDSEPSSAMWGSQAHSDILVNRQPRRADRGGPSGSDNAIPLPSHIPAHFGVGAMQGQHDPAFHPFQMRTTQEAEALMQHLLAENQQLSNKNTLLERELRDSRGSFLQASEQVVHLRHSLHGRSAETSGLLEANRQLEANWRRAESENQVLRSEVARLYPHS